METNTPDSGMEPLTPEDVGMIAGGTPTGTRSPPPPPPVTSPITVTANPPPPPPVTSPITVTANPPPPPGGGGSPPPPPTPPKNPNCAAPAISVDNGFITQNEGSTNTGYVPTKNGVPLGTSGVTVGIGVDLGSKTAAGLASWGLSQTLINQLTPYLGLTGTAAQQELASNPLTLSAADSAALSNAAIAANISSLSSAFNNAASFADFNQLPPNTQTAIADVAYQYGDLASKTPNFWSQITTGDWAAALSNLNNFGDDYATRRAADAALLQNDINNYTMPTPATPC